MKLALIALTAVEVICVVGIVAVLLRARRLEREDLQDRLDDALAEDTPQGYRRAARLKRQLDRTH